VRKSLLSLRVIVPSKSVKKMKLGFVLMAGSGRVETAIFVLMREYGKTRKILYVG
jgi:hypothetical protein